MGYGDGAGAGRGQGKFTGKKCRLISMFCLTTAFFLVEILTGYYTNSMALVADSFHMLSDIAALVIAFLSVRMAPKSWSKNTFGWARAEVLGALVNAVFLVALCFSITVESLKRFYEMETIHNPRMILYVGVMGLIVNLIGLFLFHEHGSSHGHSHGLSRSTHSHLTDLADKEEKEEISEIVYPGVETGHSKHVHSHGHSHSASNMNMRGVFLHVLADALGSVIVIISAVIMWKTDWWFKDYADPALSLLLVILILKSVQPLLMDSALILLQTVPTHIQVDNLQTKLMERVEGILAVHEFHVWQLTGDRIIASAHIRCLNLAQYMEVAEKVKEFFHHEGIHSTTIQPEFVETEPLGLASTDDCVLACPKGPKTLVAGCEASKCCPPGSKTSSTGQVTTPKSRSRQTSPSAKIRRPSSVSITKETSQGKSGITVSSPNRRSAPNLSVNEPSPENTIEMTAELNLSDSAPSSNNSSFRQEAPVPLLTLGPPSADSKAFCSTPAKPNYTSTTPNTSNGGSAGLAANRYSVSRISGSDGNSGLSSSSVASPHSMNGSKITAYNLDTIAADRRMQQQQQLTAEDLQPSDQDDHLAGVVGDEEELTPMVPRTKTRIVRRVSKQSNV